MSRVGEEGRSKSHGCVTCLIINLVIIVIFIAALFIGGSILFNNNVSPQIGGVTFSEALSLMGKVMVGKDASVDYTEEDLDAFYSDLSESLFLSDKTDMELAYELLSEETKASLAAESVSAAEAEESSSASYDDEAAYEYFSSLPLASRYALLSSQQKSAITESQFAALAADAQKDLRKTLGLKMYRISAKTLLEGFTSSDGEFSTEGAVEQLVSSLDFNFAMLADYDIHDPSAAENMRFNSITLDGKEVSAFINDIVTYFLGSSSSPLAKTLQEKLPADIDLTEYVKVASVTIMNTPLATSGDEALYDQKDTALGMVLNIRLRDIVVMMMSTPEMKAQLSSVPSFALSIIPKLIPKRFSVGATVYPLANEEDGREVKIKINNSKDKHAATLSKIVNALAGKGSSEGEGEATTSFFAGINAKVTDVFKSVNEKVKINFVPSRDKEGNALKDDNGNTYSQMRIMTVETLLALIDSSGELSAHDIFTVMKCLYVANDKHAALVLDAAIDAVKTEVLSNYGVDTSSVSMEKGFSTDTLNDLLKGMDLKKVDFTRSNDEMRIHLSAEALAAIMLSVLSSSDSSEEGESSIFASLAPSICEITIKKVADTENVYALELLLSSSLSEMIRKQFDGEEGIAATLVPKLLPKGESYFGVKLYLSEETDEEGKVTHRIGRNISGDDTYAAAIRINDFSYEETADVLSIMNKFLNVLGGTDFDIKEITSSAEDAVSDMFSSLSESDLSLKLMLFEQNEASNGGILLPSIYELFSDTVTKKGELAKDEFSPDDAQAVLSQIYKKDVNTDKVFEDAQSDEFLDELQDKYYIGHTVGLSASELFGGDGKSASPLDSKLNSDAIYFKPNEEEITWWQEHLGDPDYVKPALYTDTERTTLEQLRVPLTGSEIAALINAGGAFPEDLASSFGSIAIIGAHFTTDEGKTYLIFDILCSFSKSGSGDEELNLTALFPEELKFSAKILLYAPSYPDGEKRFSSSLLINDETGDKIFTLLKALGSSDLSEETMTSKLSESIEGIFTTLEENIKLYFSNDGVGYTVTKDGKEESCIYLADVFTALIDTMEIKDEAGDTLTDAADLRSRLLSYGQQILKDTSTDTYNEWTAGLDLSLFTAEDKAYVSLNMQDAYFMKVAPDLDNIYKDVGGEFTSFSSESFYLYNIFDEEGKLLVNGLYQYSDTPRVLKINGKALGAMISYNTSGNASFASAVSTDSGMQAALVGLRLEYVDENTLRIYSALKLSFNNDPLMPGHFFIKAITEETVDGSKRSYSTVVSINDLTPEETAKFFYNITSFMGDSVKFNISDIEDTISDAIKTALGNFVDSSNVKVTYGSFSEEDGTYYATDLYEDTATPSLGEGYLSIPSVYSFFADLLFTGDHAKDRPKDDRDLQRMLNAMYQDESVLETNVLRNEKTESIEGAYYLDYEGLYYNTSSKLICAYSDTYLAHYLSVALKEFSLDDGNISLASGIDQMIILRKPDVSDGDTSLIRTERAYWAEKFGTLDDDTDYLIVTIRPKFNKYSASAGSDESILPSTLWFTVLIDLNEEENSKGLLYDMTTVDMSTFESVLSANESPFDIDSIAEELAHNVNSSLLVLEMGMNRKYETKEDDYIYYDASDEKNIATDIAKGSYSCIGYMVLESKY